MYLLYLDDAGSARNRNENYFVLGGICMHESKTHFINQRLDKLAEALNPADPDSVEFHASEIFSGRTDPWRSLEKNARRETIKNVLDVANQEARDTAVFACAVHKESFPGHDPVAKAFEDICSRFNLFLKRKYHNSGESHRGIIIFDESAHETQLQALARGFRKIGTRWGVTANLPEVPLFVNSEASRSIQLADHIAYSVFRRYESGDLNYFNVIQGRFDSEGDRIHGLCHLQTKIPDCTCPACLSRKLAPPPNAPTAPR